MKRLIYLTLTLVLVACGTRRGYFNLMADYSTLTKVSFTFIVLTVCSTALTR